MSKITFVKIMKILHYTKSGNREYSEGQLKAKEVLCFYFKRSYNVFQNWFATNLDRC